MNQISRPGDLLVAETAAHAEPAQPVRRIATGRRGFLTAAAALGGGFVLGFSYAGKARAAATGGTVNVFVVIAADNTVTIISPGAEMGQGIHSGLSQVLSEELPLDWTKLKTASAPWGVQYSKNGSQITGGSMNMRNWFTRMLQVGATAREMLLTAARAQFPSAPAPLKADAGVVKDANGAVLATYGELAEAASTVVLASAAPLMSSGGNYKVVGQKRQRPDIRKKVDGSAIFGIDVRLPGMVFGSVRHCPTRGGIVASMGSAPAGMTAVNLGDAVAVTGPNTWAATKAVRALSVSWTLPGSAALALVDSSALATAAQTLMTSGTPAVAEALPAGATAASVASVVDASPKKLTLTYSLPFLAHACMEVVNCTVQLTRDSSGAVTGANVWCPTQAPEWVAATVAGLIPSLKTAAGKPDPAKIVVNTTYLGGGLGRKIEQDYVSQAVKVALAVNAPVKLTWMREEDFSHDWFRPAALSKVQVGLDANGKITGWYNRVVAASCLRSHGFAPPLGTPGFIDSVAVGSAVGNGAEPMPYATAMQTRVVEYVEQQTGFKIGFWRSVGQSISCFVVESAIDECARLAGVDPYQYRRGMLPAGSALLGVLDAAWNLAASYPMPSGAARGIALSPGFGSHCALVAELAIVTTTSSTGTVTTSYRPTRLFAAVDCGLAVNPDEVVSQIEGGLLHGLNSARWGQVRFSKGVCSVKNFEEYKLGRIADTPQIFVKVISSSTAQPGGIGEVGVPPVAPALANAYAQLTGTRKRSLPLGI